MAKTTNYLNGIFVTKREGQYGEYLSVGITEDGLKELANLSKSDSGFRNFTLTPQKNNPEKYSAKPFVPKSDSSNDSGLPF